MTASLYVNHRCSRCPRVEQREVTLEQAVALAKTEKKAPPALLVELHGEHYGALEALCSVCEEVVLKYMELILTTKKHASSSRTRSISVEVEPETKKKG
jgi:hypothetical protein